jgi:hypothetical protein
VCASRYIPKPPTTKYSVNKVIITTFAYQLTYIPYELNLLAKPCADSTTTDFFFPRRNRSTRENNRLIDRAQSSLPSSQHPSCPAHIPLDYCRPSISPSRFACVTKRTHRSAVCWLPLQSGHRPSTPPVHSMNVPCSARHRFS